MTDMMTAAVRAFQVLDRADIQFGTGVTLVAGENSAGKSSLAKALAGGLTGDVLHGVLKKDAKGLVRDGAKSGTVQITGAGGTVSISYPKGEVTSQGTPPTLGRIAAGIDSLIDLDAKKRSLLLGDLLKTAPSRDDLAAALADHGFKDEPAPEVIDEALTAAGKRADPSASLADHVKLLRSIGAAPNIIEWVWQQIEMRGWDDAYTKVSREITELKGRWAEVTGGSFGSQKAQNWAPEGWTPDLGEASETGLTNILSAAKEALEQAVAKRAVDQSAIADLRQESAKLDTTKAAAQAASEAKMDAEVALVDAEAKLSSAQRAVDGLLPTELDSGLACPHCDGRVHLHRGPAGMRLDKAERVSDDELKQRRLAKADADGTLSNAKGVHAAAKTALNEAQRALDTAQRAVAEAESATRTLAEMEANAAAQGQGGSTDADLQKARAAVDAAERRITLYRTKVRADGISRNLTAMTSIQAALAPDGCRQAKLMKVLGTFNDNIIRPLCAAAGWPVVRIEADMSVTSGGKPYEALKGLGPQITSEQWKARAILQAALAQRAGDSLVILDAADVLDQAGRNGLFAMLGHADMAAVVCMTFSQTALVNTAQNIPKSTKIPDLEKANLGRTYWIAGGVAMPLAEAIAATAVQLPKVA